MKRESAQILVKVYAVLFWLGALGYFFLALALIFGGSLLAALSGGMLGMGGIDEGILGGVLAAAGMVIGILLLAYMALCIWVGIGLWRFQSWARIVALVLCAFEVLFFPIGTLVGILGIALFGFSDEVKELFAGKPAAKVASPSKRKRAKRRK